MIHSIRNRDNRIALCGKTLKFNDGVSTSLKEIECRECKKLLINSFISESENKIAFIDKVLKCSVNDDLAKRLNDDKENELKKNKDYRELYSSNFPS
jgi:hypothetical protein